MITVKQIRTGQRQNARHSRRIVRLHNHRGEAAALASPPAAGRSARAESVTSRPAIEPRRGASVNRNKTNMERIRTMTDKAKAPGSEMFDQALKNYEQPLRSGHNFSKPGRTSQT